MSTPPYGQADTTFQAAGGEAGVRRLVDDFYDIMEHDPRYQAIWSWHPEDRAASRDKLARFLCGWMGGPRLYQEKYGPISIPGVHRHLRVTDAEVAQWLGCMSQAIARQGYPTALADYLLAQLAVPAEMIRRMANP